MSNLELNKGDNFIFCFDVSSSMGITDTPSGASRIDYLKEKLQAFVEEAGKYDDDGIDLITFGHIVKTKPKLTPATAGQIIGELRADEGATFTEKAIKRAFELHRAGGYAQTVCFVATDGAPSDKEAVKATIRDIASQLKPDPEKPEDSHEFAISFLTVGKIDDALRGFLSELDDDLKAKYDIVDVKALDDVDFVTAFVGALHD